MNVFSARTHLRPTQHEDLRFLQALWNDGEVMRYKGYPQGMHVTDECMERWWAMTPQAQASGASNSPLAPPHCVIELLDGTPIGELSFSVDVQHRALIDLKLASSFRGQGYATEILTALVRELFATSRVTKAVMEPSATNTAAVKLMRRGGFHQRRLKITPTAGNARATILPSENSVCWQRWCNTDTRTCTDLHGQRR